MSQPAPDDGFQFTMSRTLRAPRALVFQAWTDPAHLVNWWGAHPSWTTPVAEIDLRVGGFYRLGMQDPEQDHPYIVGGVYREVSPPSRLVFTWAWERRVGDDSEWVPAETLVTIDFAERDGVTEVTLTQEQFPDAHMRDEHNRGWNGCIDRLEQLLATPAV